MKEITPPNSLKFISVNIISNKLIYVHLCCVYQRFASRILVIFARCQKKTQSQVIKAESEMGCLLKALPKACALLLQEELIATHTNNKMLNLLHI